MIRRFFNNIRFLILKFKIKKSLSLSNELQVKSLKVISFNGRSCSLSFKDKKSNSKFFLKYFLHSNINNISVSDLVSKKYHLVSLLSEENLITYKCFKFDHLTDSYVRNFLHGVVFSEYVKTLNNSDFETKMSELLVYIDKVLNCMAKNSLLYCLDLRLDNFIILNSGRINIIDLDLSHTNATTTNIDNANTMHQNEFKSHTYAKFVEKVLPTLGKSFQTIFYNLVKRQISDFKDFKGALLSRFFYSEASNSFDSFILDNYLNFSDDIISFSDASVKQKLIETLSELNFGSYLVARRYDWLINDGEFNSKDIDIYCREENILEVLSAFKKNGWDIYNGKIKQYFDHHEMLVKIDLRTDSEKRYKLKINDLVKRSEQFNNIQIIGEDDYHEIMILNLLYSKKYIKNSYFKEFTEYYPNSLQSFKDKYLFLLDYDFSKYGDKLFLTIFYKFRRILGDFWNHKSLILLGADGAGKSTFSYLLYKNISLLFKTKRKYYGGFFYPSGRTNLFLLKTSIFFKIAKLIKDFISNNFTPIKTKKTNNLSSSIGSFSAWRKLSIINKSSMQLFFILLLPIFIIDIWIHKIVFRFSSNRLYICDRYYDDIVINFTSPLIRKLIRFILPRPDLSFYFYTTPELHFDRKKNENIEMIVHMQTCYSENSKYHLKLPTNAKKSFLGKKIISMSINNLK
jgi:thymidylate kinase